MSKKSAGGTVRIYPTGIAHHPDYPAKAIDVTPEEAETLTTSAFGDAAFTTTAPSAAPAEEFIPADEPEDVSAEEPEE